MVRRAQLALEALEARDQPSTSDPYSLLAVPPPTTYVAPTTTYVAPTTTYTAPTDPYVAMGPAPTSPTPIAPATPPPSAGPVAPSPPPPSSPYTPT